jgi:DNA-binding transcriptional ArsR family regulator
MPETIDAFDELQTIRVRLDAIEQTQEMLVRANSAEILRDVDALTHDDDLAIRVYLLVDGQRTQGDIADELGTTQPTVSKKITKLQQLHLVRVVEKRGGGNVYAKAAADRILRLSPRIRERLRAP